jgi:hypothetical protein
VVFEPSLIQYKKILTFVDWHGYLIINSFFATMEHIRAVLLIRTVLFFAAFLFFVFKGMAQTRFSGWVAANNMFKFSNRFSIHLDVQARSTDQVRQLETFIFRPGINWHFRKNMMATAGYGFILHHRNISGITGYAPEHRIWEQLIVNHNAGFIPIQHRFRLEQRFVVKSSVQHSTLQNDGNWFANRFRYFTRAIIPLNGSKPFARGMFGAVQNEVFLNWGDKSNVNGKVFDQNRFYLATGFRFSPEFDLEIGYLNHYVSGSNSRFTNNHVLQVATYTRL